MSKNSSEKLPFKALGAKLRLIREKTKLTLAEVSGAVEIEPIVLERIESGYERPAEDILMLLISYFNMQDNEATKLWELAGYSSEPEPVIKDGMPTTKQPMIMVMAMDLRTLYSDSLDINCNPAGMTLTFNQSTDQDSKSPVAKIGISYDHAERVLMAMQEALNQAKMMRQPKLLQPPKQKDQKADQ